MLLVRVCNIFIQLIVGYMRRCRLIMSRLPIFHDDHNFREQTERMFREMEEKMGFHHHPHNPPFQDLMSGGARWPPTFDDSTFFQLRPLAAITQPVFLLPFSFLLARPTSRLRAYVLPMLLFF